MGVFKRGNTWWIDYYADGKRVREAIGTEQQAKAVLAKRTTELWEGTFELKRTKKTPTLREFAPRYLASYVKVNNKESSYTRDVTSLKSLLPFFGDKSMNRIEPMLVEHYKRKRLADGREHQTINNELNCLKGIFSRAEEWGVMPKNSNPVKLVKMLPTDNEVMNLISDEDEALLLQHAAPHLRDIIICGLETGMRRGEMFNLQWRDVDLERRLITVRKTKTGKVRRIDINERLYVMLTGRERNSTDAPWVFTSPKTGEKLTKIDTAWRRANERAGLRHKGYRVHDLRHCFASRLIDEGESLAKVKALMGHSTVRMLERYVHVEGSLAGTVGALDRRRARRQVIDLPALSRYDESSS